MSITINNQTIEKNNYGNYDLSNYSFEELESYGVFLAPEKKYHKLNSDIVVIMGYLGMDDSMVGSTAFAKSAKPIIERFVLNPKNEEIYEELESEYIGKIVEGKKGYSIVIKDSIEDEGYIINQKNVEKLEIKFSMKNQELATSIADYYNSGRSLSPIYVKRF